MVDDFIEKIRELYLEPGIGFELRKYIKMMETDNQNTTPVIAYEGKQIALIVACDNNGGIGITTTDNANESGHITGTIPWKYPEDTRFFREHTTQAPVGTRNACVMGSVTYFSIPQKFRPLTGRINIVISGSPERFDNEPGLFSDLFVFPDIESAMDFTKNKIRDVHNIFICGGKMIYDYFIAGNHKLDYAVVTQFPTYSECNRSIDLEKLRGLFPVTDDVPLLSGSGNYKRTRFHK